MVGEVLQVQIGCDRKLLLHRFGNRPVQHATLTCEQLAINGLPRQRVPERKLVGRFFDHELSRYQFFHDQEELVLIILGKLLEKGKIKMPPGHGSQGQHVPGRFAHTCCSSLYGVLNAAWNGALSPCPAIPIALDVENVTGCNERAERFLDEKGVALRQRVESIQEFPVQKAAHVETRVLLLKDGRQHRIDLVACKRHEPDLVSEPFAVKLCKPAAQLWLHLLMAVRDQEQERMRRRAPRKRVEEVQARVVAPVDGLQDEKHPLPPNSVES